MRRSKTTYILSLLIAIPLPGLCQDAIMIPLRVETSVGWNVFTHSGINDDMKIIRDSTQYTDYGIPIGSFGRGPNLNLVVTTHLTDRISAGISLQYYGTSGYYGFDGTSISAQTATEVEFKFSRVASQAAVDYSYPIRWKLPSTVSVRMVLGATFVNLRKDINFALTPSTPTLPFFLPPFALHIIGQYSAINPELGSQVSFAVDIISNVRIKGSIAWVYSPSKKISGTFNSMYIEEISKNESFKEALLRDIDLGYSGVTFGAGFEFGL